MGLMVVSLVNFPHNGIGSEAIERLHFLASLPLAGTVQREGGEKMQPFNRFQSRLGSWTTGKRQRYMNGQL